MKDITRRQFGKTVAGDCGTREGFAAGVFARPLAVREPTGQPAISAGICVGMRDGGLPD